MGTKVGTRIEIVVGKTSEVEIGEIWKRIKISMCLLWLSTTKWTSWAQSKPNGCHDCKDLQTKLKSPIRCEGFKKYLFHFISNGDFTLSFYQVDRNPIGSNFNSSISKSKGTLPRDTIPNPKNDCWVWTICRVTILNILLLRRQPKLFLLFFTALNNMCFQCVLRRSWEII